MTRILQGVLTGDSKTSVICNVNQDNQNCNETLSTLRFGIEAGSIKLNLEKDSSPDESPGSPSRPPSTSKEELRDKLAKAQHVLGDLELENFRLKSMFEMEQEKLKGEQNISKEKDWLVANYKNQNDMLEKTVKDIREEMKKIKEQEKQKKILEEKEELVEDKRINSESEGNNFPSNLIKKISSATSQKLTKSMSKSPIKNSQKFIKKRFERKSRNVSPRVSASPKSNPTIFDKVTLLKKENQKLKQQLTIMKIKGSKEIISLNSKSGKKTFSKVKKRPVKQIKKIQTSPEKREIKKQLSRIRRQYREIKKEEEENRKEMEKLKGTVRNLKEKLKQEKRENKDLRLDLIRRQGSPLAEIKEGKRKKPGLDKDDLKKSKIKFKSKKKNFLENIANNSQREIDENINKNQLKIQNFLPNPVSLDYNEFLCTDSPKKQSLNDSNIKSKVKENQWAKPATPKRSRSNTPTKVSNFSQVNKLSNEAQIWSKEPFSVNSSILNIRFSEFPTKSEQIKKTPNSLQSQNEGKYYVQSY